MSRSQKLIRQNKTAQARCLRRSREERGKGDQTRSGEVLPSQCTAAIAISVKRSENSNTPANMPKKLCPVGFIVILPFGHRG